MRNSITFDDKEYPLEDDFWKEFNKHLKLKHLKAADVYKKVGFTNRTFSNAKRLKSDGTRNPSRNEAIKLAVGLEILLEDTKKLLAKAGYTLSRCNRFELLLLACKDNGIHKVISINLRLYDNELPILGDSEE